MNTTKSTDSMTTSLPVRPVIETPPNTLEILRVRLIVLNARLRLLEAEMDELRADLARMSGGTHGA